MDRQTHRQKDEETSETKFLKPQKRRERKALPYNGSPTNKDKTNFLFAKINVP